MKTFAILAVAVTLAVICMANCVAALPLEEEVHDVVFAAVPTDNTVPKDQVLPEVEEHSRHKRATCDLLSKFNVNHSACAAHCLLKRYKGGYCNSKQVCVCRR